MDLTPLRPWLVLVHVLGVLGFMLAHGASAAVAFRLRRERDPARIRALLDLSAGSLNAMHGALTVLFVAGILSGIAGAWFTSGRWWLWTAIALLVGIVVAMYALATEHFAALRHAVGLATPQDLRSGRTPPPAASPPELEGLLRSPRPMVAAAIGLGGIAVITWLMVLKPF